MKFRRHVMALQGRMLDEFVRRRDAPVQHGIGNAPPNEVQAPGDEARTQERFALHRKRVTQTPTRVARSVVRRLDLRDGSEVSAFSPEDRAILRSIAELDVEAIGWRSSGPMIRRMRALPTRDIRGRGRLMNEAGEAERAVVDAAVASRLGGLTADGSQRIEALVRSDAKFGTATETDWEGVAVDLPQLLESITESACERFDLMVGVREIIDGNPSPP